MLTETEGTSGLMIFGQVAGLEALPGNPETIGFHVHQYGDTSPGLDGVNCSRTGGHWNPTGVNHGAYDAAVRHVGDMKPITAGAALVNYMYTDHIASLFGHDSIGGRSLVIHTMGDDQGQGEPADSSKANGNAGPRLACCTISFVATPEHGDD